MTSRWYAVHAYSNFEKKVAELIREQAKQRGLSPLFEEILVPTEKVVEVRRGRQGRRRAQILPGLCPGENGNDGRGLSPDQEYAEGDRLSRLRQQADAVVGCRGGAHHPSSAGGHRAAEALGLLRGRRTVGCRTARSPPSTVRWRRWTKRVRGSRSRCRSSACVILGSNWNSGRWRSYRTREAVGGEKGVRQPPTAAPKQD